jgi:hypothetical protein
MQPLACPLSTGLCRLLAAVLAALCGFAAAAHASPGLTTPSAGTNAMAEFQIAAQCEAAAILAGRAAGIPERVLPAMALIESGRRGADGGMHPWPWSIDVEGTDHVYASRAEAIAAVRLYQAAGIRSIDVGCLQVNLMHHPDAFASLEQAFDPMQNARYAAGFLRDLHAQSGSWAKAIGDYHSATPALGETYRRHVMAVLGGAAPQEGVAALGTTSGPGLRMPGWMAARRLIQQNTAMLGSPPAPGALPSATMGPAAPRLAPSGAGSNGGASAAAIIGRGLGSYRARPVWNGAHPVEKPG